MKGILTTLAVMLIVGTLAGCASNREDARLVPGGVVGGMSGSAVTGGGTSGMLVGTVGGAYVGRESH